MPGRAGLEPLGAMRRYAEPVGRAGAEHVPIRLATSVPGQLRRRLLCGQVP